MTPPIKQDQLTQFLEGFGIWITDHAGDIAADLVDDASSQEPTPIVTHSMSDLRHAAVVLGVFTSRAAMRKAIHYFANAPAWQDKDRFDYLVIAVNELQTAILNCNEALKQLGIPDAPGVVVAGDQADAGQGGGA